MQRKVPENGIDAHSDEQAFRPTGSRTRTLRKEQTREPREWIRECSCSWLVGLRGKEWGQTIAMPLRLSAQIKNW